MHMMWTKRVVTTSEGPARLIYNRARRTTVTLVLGHGQPPSTVSRRSAHPCCARRTSSPRMRGIPLPGLRIPGSQWQRTTPPAVGVSRCSVRHPVERAAESRAGPGSLARRSRLGRGPSAPSAFLGNAAGRPRSRSAGTVEATQDRACAPAEHVELAVRGNDFVGDQLRGGGARRRGSRRRPAARRSPSIRRRSTPDRARRRRRAIGPSAPGFGHADC